MTLEEYLKEVKERCSNATEGPWVSDGMGYCFTGNEESNMIADVLDHQNLRARGTGSGIEFIQQFKNMEFIAHSRQDVPALVEMVVRMRKCILSVNLMYPGCVNLKELESLIPTKEGE